MNPYIGSPRGHEDGKMCEVVAGARGGIATDVHGLAAVRGPVTLQAVSCVLPEGTFGHVGFEVDGLCRGKGNKRSR